MMREERNVRRWPLLAACALSAALAASPARGAELVFARDASGSPDARRAVTLCLDSAKADDDAKREAMLRQGLDVAERAVAANPNEAKAHFAVFCNLGRALEADGASFAGVAQLSRLKAAIDRTLALEPRFVDAMTAKGSLLVRLPGILGGDADEGEHLLRRAVELAPNHAPSRLELAKALDEKGDKEAALEEARKALSFADSPTVIAEARVLAEQLGS